MSQEEVPVIEPIIEPINEPESPPPVEDGVDEEDPAPLKDESPKVTPLLEEPPRETFAVTEHPKTTVTTGPGLSDMFAPKTTLTDEKSAPLLEKTASQP